MTEPSAERAARLRLLLALEIDRITRDLRERLDFLVVVWSRFRKREAFLQTLFSRWPTVTLSDLAGLDAEAIGALEAFYGELDKVRLYVSWTEDMPGTLRDHLEHRIARLERAAAPALEALGGAPVQVRPDALPLLPLEPPDPPPDPANGA